MPKLVLLGDSIFDNAAYVGSSRRDVAAHLREKLAGSGWSVELRAVDGATAAEVRSQLRPAPDADLFVLSAGGNDALAHSDLLSDPTPRAFAAFMLELHGVRERFRADYRGTLEAILALAAPLVCCTIYNPQFPDERMRQAGATALSLFNDVIIQECLKRRLPVIDLREVATGPEHFANPIEPSEAGGEKIAEAIVSALNAVTKER